MTENIYKCPKCNGTGLYLNGGMMSIKCDYCSGTGRVSIQQYEAYMGIVHVNTDDKKEEKIEDKSSINAISNNVNNPHVNISVSNIHRKAGHIRKHK